MSYKVNEIFYSLQGEGRNTGRAAVFVRFSGCNMRCTFCDTDFSKYEEMAVSDIIERVKSALPPDADSRERDKKILVVLTGGEPSLQTDKPLIDALHKQGLLIAMETNGSNNVAEGIDWLTVSPKGKTTIRRCNELKVIYNGKDEPSDGGIIADYYYLQPCDTGNKDTNDAITAKCVEYIKQHPQWRLSLQTHKLINIK